MLTFIETIYLPRLTLAPSTIAGYRDCHKHVLSHLGDHTLASMKTADVADLLQKVADKSKVSKTTLQHVKHYLSGIYTWGGTTGRKVARCPTSMEQTRYRERSFLEGDGLKKPTPTISTRNGP